MTDYGRKQRYSVRNLRGPRRGGEAEPTCRVRGGTSQLTASHQKRVLASRGASPFEETAVYIKVRTVVWEDGVARPLLPDSASFCKGAAGASACRLRFVNGATGASARRLLAVQDRPTSFCKAGWHPARRLAIGALNSFVKSDFVLQNSRLRFVKQPGSFYLESPSGVRAKPSRGS
jgi:hypothetical protein